ncbi:MAG: glycosyltransferase family 4 protein, partial [Eubacterium sp.]|nr:glycosyltransferase family 4 protein [Eubacterium sp.]
MRILVAANFDVGLYKFRKELLQEFINRGHQVYISLPKGDLVAPLVEMGCEFIETDIDRRGTNPLTDIKLIMSYKSILKKVKPDLVITYTIKPNIYMGIACRQSKTPYAINITGLGTAFQNSGTVLKLFTVLYKFACKKANTVIFENCDNMQTFVNFCIVKNEQCLLNNGAGVNIEEYVKAPYPNDNEIRFLFIGRVMKEKGIDELFSAAKRMNDEYDNIYFDIVGPYEDDYKDITERLQAQGIITYYGYQEDVKPFIEKCHCFVLPSWHEGMANTNLECGAMGRPIITSDINGCLEAVINNKSGFLVQPKNSNDLYDKIKSFIYLPYEEKVQMAECSHNHIVEHFDKKLIVE